jgi:hypothetical protein
MTTSHIEDNGQHIKELDRRLGDLSAAFGDLGSTDDFDELLRVIHGPGWTTLTHLSFMNALVDATQRTVQDARHLRLTLLEGARAIAGESGR